MGAERVLNGTTQGLRGRGDHAGMFQPPPYKLSCKSSLTDSFPRCDAEVPADPAGPRKKFAQGWRDAFSLGKVQPCREMVGDLPRGNRRYEAYPTARWAGGGSCRTFNQWQRWRKNSRRPSFSAAGADPRKTRGNGVPSWTTRNG